MFLEESAWRGKIYSTGWRPAIGGDAAVVEPATGAELGRTGLASGADVAAATAAAAAAQPAWAALPYTGDRFGGTANLDVFTGTRWVTLRGEIATYPF